jgi:hypothetical protein
VAEEPVDDGEQIARRPVPKDEGLEVTPETLAPLQEPDSPPETRIADTEAPVLPAPATEQPGEPPAAERPLTVAVAPAPSVPEAPPALPTAPDSKGETTPEEVGLGEPMILAMNFSGPLHYADPLGSAPLEHLGQVRNQISDLPMPQALVPAHVGHTLSESPTLYWYASTATDSRVKFLLRDRGSVDPLLEFTLDPPVRAGIHAVHLRDHGVVLEPGVEYRWFVSVSPGAGEEFSADLVTRGGIERTTLGAELRAKLEAAPPSEVGKFYAKGGLWYDALASVSEAIEHAPQEARLRALRAELLEQVGLRQAADYDRSAVPTNPAP